MSGFDKPSLQAMENFERFRLLVLRETALQEELRGITDREAFMDRVVQLGAAHDCEFTAAEVVEAMRSAHRAWLERWIA
jgi:hypothetical protein